MRLKNNSIQLNGIRTELLLGLNIVDSLHYEMFGNSMEITSVCDKDHMENSLHYCGSAVDISDDSIEPVFTETFVKEVKNRLGCEFDFLYEKNHFHLEWQPRTKEHYQI